MKGVGTKTFCKSFGLENHSLISFRPHSHPKGLVAPTGGQPENLELGPFG